MHRGMFRVSLWVPVFLQGAQIMAKKLIVLCDGTAASPEGQPDNPSNVRILYQILGQQQPVTESDPLQGWEIKDIDKAQHALECKVYYHRGLGAIFPEPDPKNLSWRQWFARFINPAGRTMSEVAALGIMNQVKELYYFLAKHYEVGDPIYLFGFSRGAYALRILITFIRHIGLVNKQKCSSDVDDAKLKVCIEQGFALYSKDIHPDDNQAVKDFRCNKSHHHREIMHFLGLWDTVPGYIVESVRKDNTLTSVVKTARHAIAIDEDRDFFASDLWHPSSMNQDSLQMWFTGNHCDIGGFYTEKERTLANITLMWMVEEAIKSGLILDAQALQPYRENSSSLAIQHDSFCEAVVPGAPITWENICRFYARTMVQTTSDERVHSSVLERYGKRVLVQRGLYCEEESYNPVNLKAVLFAFNNLNPCSEPIPRPETLPVSHLILEESVDDWVGVTFSPSYQTHL